MNFYRYVNGNPVNRRDPSGLVSGNCAPVASYFAVPWSRVQDVARSPKALGVTTGRINVECECVKDGCDKWRPQVTVNAEINVFYANDTTIPPEMLRRDEAEHVTAVQAIVSGTCRAGAALEATRFSSKTVCDWNCFVFKASAWLALFLEGPRTHFQSPSGHEYP